MMSRKNESPIWLSEIVQQAIHDDYPQLAPLKTHNGLKEQILQNFPHIFRVALIVFLLSLSFNELFVWRGWIFSTYALNAQQAADILASSLEYLAGLVGIVLPIILIIVEFVSKDKGTNSLVDIYLDKTNLKTTAIAALVLLAIEVSFMTVFRASIIIHPKWIFYLILLFTLLNLAMIFETGRTIWNLRKSLSNRFLIDTLSDKLKKEIQWSQKIEVEHRLKRIANLNTYHFLVLDRIHHTSQPDNTFPVYATQTGVIKDIQLSKLGKFALLVRTSSGKATMTKLVDDSIQNGDVIAYISSDIDEHAMELQKILNESYQIGEDNEDSNINDEIKTLMLQVKQIVETSIRDENKVFFDELMSVYQQIFELSIGLPFPPSTEPLGDIFFRGWTANQLAIRHMEDFIRTAARSHQQRFMGSLSYDIFKIASSMIQSSNIVISGNLSDVLGLYVFMYIYSYDHKNTLGINRSYFYLTQEIDWVWSRSIETSHDNVQSVQNYRAILHSIMETLARIIYHAFMNNDQETFRVLLDKIHKDEFLARFHPERYLSQIYTLQQNLENTPEHKREALIKQIDALRLIRAIPTYVQDFFDDLILLATSYLFESYEKDEITPVQLEETFSILAKHFPSIRESIIAFGKLNERRLTLAGGIFNRYPDTKQAFFSDDQDKFYLFYCLRGMAYVGSDDFSNDDFYTNLSVDTRYQLPKIEETCSRIIANSTKWIKTPIFLIIDSGLSELAQKWIDLNKDIADKWLKKREDQIINSILDADKKRGFTEAVAQSISETSKGNFVNLLERNDKVFICSDLEKPIQRWQFIQKEYFTQLYPDDNYARDIGMQYGSSIINFVEKYLLQDWIDRSRFVPSRKSWENLQPYFDQIINRFNEKGYQLSYFLIPTNRHSYRWLTATPDFVPQYQVEQVDKLPKLKGYYKDIPILEYFLRNDSQELLLALDITQACKIEIGKLSTEIRDITEDEIERRLENNLSETKRDVLLLTSVKASQSFNIEVLDRDAIVRMKIKLTEPETSSIFVPSSN